MSELDRYRDVLSAGVRSVWPKLAAAVADVDGALFGGTALATHLRHRQSFDLDYMTYEHFNGETLAERLAAAAVDIDVRLAADSQMRASLDGVVVEVFTAPHPSDDPTRVTQIATPTTIDGLAVASLSDLLASKLDVLLWRAKLRDFIDIAAIDRSGRLRIEDGLRLHTERYGTKLRSGVLDEIVDLLEDPGALASDPLFADEATLTLGYLADRIPALREFLGAERALSGGTPATRSHSDARIPDPGDPLDLAAGSGTSFGASLPTAGPSNDADATTEQEPGSRTLAKRRKLSRSQLYAEAPELLVSREDQGEIARRLNEVYGRADSRLDPGLAAAQSEALREEW